MAKLAKFLQGVAGAAGGAGLNVEDVFSTYLYEGNGSTQTITNGIDLDGEGGLVWLKNRTQAYSNMLYDTERGVGKSLDTDNYFNVEQTGRTGLTSFNSNGFSLGNFTYENANGADYASWTWRKAPRFFDCVTYTGTGSNQAISHSLGTTVGSIFVKELDNSSDWRVYHRSLSSGYNLALNKTDAQSGNWSNRFVSVSDTSFTVGTDSSLNESGVGYVAYLFAHNDGDGEFGPDGDADIIKCGSFTTDSNSRATIDLGFEPQFLIFKRTDGTSSWEIDDVMRGWGETERNYLAAESSNAEGSSDNVTYPIKPTSTGFLYDLNAAGSGYANIDYIYIAIRRGPMAVPEDATDVFDVTAKTYSGQNTTVNSGFATDFIIFTPNLTGGLWTFDRLRGELPYLNTSNTNAEAQAPGYPVEFDHQDGIVDKFSGGSSGCWWQWKRAPNYFDAVAYTGNSTAGRTVSHNLGVAPEMMWVKRRDTSAADWAVYHSALGNTKQLVLNSTVAEGTVAYWNNTTPTEANFTLGAAARVNNSGSKFIAYLFASLDGVSKVGSYTGTGSGGHQIDCGFSSGARFVLIKRSSGSQNWYVFDTERGIVAGNDPSLNLNDTSTEYSSFDYIDPYSSGFELASGNISTNASGETYIFYAIA